jgi:membrane protease YdiL (CAAX protease family)
LETIETIVEQLPTCPHCQNLIRKEDTFCGSCGKELANHEVIEENHHQDVFHLLTPTLLYYFITLLLLATYKFTALFPEGLEGLIWISVLDILLVIAFWIHAYDGIKPLLRFRNLKVKIIVLTIVGAIAGSVVVSVIADLISISIYDDVFYSTGVFQDTMFPLLFATMVIAVQPAIFEEVAFRGFLFNNLKQITGGNSAVYISGFIFGIMHLQIISLLWLIPIGLVFGYLRNRYHTLWYGIIGHFTYNFCITVYEFQNWLSW